MSIYFNEYIVAAYLLEVNDKNNKYKAQLCWSIKSNSNFLYQAAI